MDVCDHDRMLYLLRMIINIHKRNHTQRTEEESARSHHGVPIRSSPRHVLDQNTSHVRSNFHLFGIINIDDDKAQLLLPLKGVVHVDLGLEVRIDFILDPLCLVHVLVLSIAVYKQAS